MFCRNFLTLLRKASSPEGKKWGKKKKKTWLAPAGIMTLPVCLCPTEILLFMWTSGLFHLPHTNFSSVFRTNFRDFQMFKITSLPVDHVSLKRMSRNFQKEAHTGKLREQPERGWQTGSLDLPCQQGTVGTLQLEKMIQNCPLTPGDVINYTTLLQKSNQSFQCKCISQCCPGWLHSP